MSGISSWNWTLDQDLAFYADAGIHTIGVSLRKLEAEGVDAACRQVAAAGVAVADVIGLGPFDLARQDTWGSKQTHARTAVKAASILGAPLLVLTTGPAGSLSWEDAADRLEDALGPVLTDARDAGVDIVLEHTNSLRADVSFVHTLRDVIDLSRRLDTGVCMEVNACWAERALATTIRDGIDRIRLVQVSDFAIGTLRTPDRLVPGDGDIPLARIVGDLVDAGYDGRFELELVGPRIEEEGYDPAIRRSLGHLGDLLSASTG